MKNIQRSRGSAGTVVLIILGVFVLFAIALCSSGGPTSSLPQVQEPKVDMDKVAGVYAHTDGIRRIRIEETYETGWNGKLSFFPAVGDWVAVLRCRVSGTDLVVDVPAKERVIIKMFKLEGPNTITCPVSPWEGTYERVGSR